MRCHVWVAAASSAPTQKRDIIYNRAWQALQLQLQRLKTWQKSAVDGGAR